MDVETITSKKEAVSKKFDELKAQRDSIDAEMNRLQGEYRLIDELLTVDPAKVIDAERTLKKETNGKK
jgi:hypothetical protein